MKIVKNNVSVSLDENGLKEYDCLNGEFGIPKNQKYFGMIVKHIDGIIPRVNIDQYGLPNEELDCYFYDFSSIKNITESIPLIFRIIKNKCGVHQYAQEIITGKLFSIGTFEELYDILSDKDCTLDFFQSKYDMCKKYPLVISNDYNGSFYPVNEQFKQVYANYHRGNEKNFKELLDEVEKEAKEKFDSNLNIMVDEVQDMAYTDNIIYNYEMRLKK